MIAVVIGLGGCTTETTQPRHPSLLPESLGDRLQTAARDRTFTLKQFSAPGVPLITHYPEALEVTVEWSDQAVQVVFSHQSATQARAAFFPIGSNWM
ncbi:hypothetical protein C7271_19775 [filamentous cyanobacterium CCP5]|nr:hypothetical protein C7271_19775 [filamentous cyanobacterium CCP5]